MEALTAAQHKAAQSLYQQAAGGQSAGPQGAPGTEPASGRKGGGASDVIDAEVVDEGKQ
jgi:hypothetical protein